MTLFDIYKDLVDEIVTQLKTITPELADDIAADGGPRVTKWLSSRSPRVGRYEAEVKAGPMTIKKLTTKSTDNDFQVAIDLIFYSSEFESGFDSVLNVAERIYNQFHLTTINGNCRTATVELFPGDGQISGRNLLAIPIRILVNCQKVISQT